MQVCFLKTVGLLFNFLVEFKANQGVILGTKKKDCRVKRSREERRKLSYSEEESNSSDSDTSSSDSSDSTTSERDSQPQPVVRTSRKNYAVNGKSKDITSTVLLSVDNLDEVHPLLLARPAEPNLSHFVKEIETNCVINVEKSYSMFYIFLSSNGSQRKLHLKESTFSAFSYYVKSNKQCNVSLYTNLMHS